MSSAHGSHARLMALGVLSLTVLGAVLFWLGLRHTAADTPRNLVILLSCTVFFASCGWSMLGAGRDLSAPEAGSAGSVTLLAGLALVAATLAMAALRATQGHLFGAGAWVWTGAMAALVIGNVVLYQFHARVRRARGIS